MDIRFTNTKLAKLCNSDKNLRSKYGQAMARVIQRRLIDLRDAETLETMRLLPGKCHELTQNLKGLLAVSLIGADRLAFEPDHNPLPVRKGGGLDWAQVTAILVVGIGDYHN